MKRYPPKKVFGNSEFCSYRQNHSRLNSLENCGFGGKNKNQSFQNLFSGDIFFGENLIAWSSGSAPRGSIPGPCPQSSKSQITAFASPRARIVPPSSKDCAPKKVTGSVPLKCSSETSKIHGYHSRIREQKLFFQRFCNKDPFFCGFPPKSVKICGFFKVKTFFGPKLRESSRIFCGEDFFLVFTPAFVEISNKNLCFFVHTLKFEVLKFLFPPKICLCPPVMLSWRRAWWLLIVR